MRGLLPRVLAPGADMKTHSWCVADSRLGLSPVSWEGKGAVKENRRPARHPVGQHFYLPDVQMMTIWGPDRKGDPLSSLCFFLCTFVARKAFQMRLRSSSECRESSRGGRAVP
jgi:hypothetical protein